VNVYWLLYKDRYEIVELDRRKFIVEHIYILFRRIGIILKNIENY
jgi:hypothetical protein